MMILADKRYQRTDKRSKMPAWITTHLKDATLNLSTDMAVHVARDFLRRMAQPVDHKQAASATLLDKQALTKREALRPKG